MTLAETRPPRPGRPPLPPDEPDTDALRSLEKAPPWVLWKYELVEDKWTKVPYQANGAKADSTNPRTWTTYGRALAAVKSGRFDGVGVVLNGDWSLVGWDFDHCIDPATGEMDPTTERRVRQLGSYAEVTPSGTGIRVFVRGRLPPSGRKKGSVECYDGKRFLTVTGQHLEGTPTAIESRQDEIDVLHAEVFASPDNDRARPRLLRVQKPVTDLGDAELVARIRASKQGEKFDALFHRGDASAYHGGHDSVADLALCCILAWWTANDAARVERLFGQSKLAERAKWDRADYRARTVAEAVARTTTTVLDGGDAPADPWPPGASPVPVNGATVQPLATLDTTPEPWDEPIPLGRADAPPSFPTRALPDWQREYVEALAEETQTPADLASVCVLPPIATAAQGRVEVEPRPGWREPVNL